MENAGRGEPAVDIAISPRPAQANSFD